MPSFSKESPARKAVERESLPQAEPIRHMVIMPVVVKKHWNDYQVEYDFSQRSEAISSLESNR